VCVVQSCFGRIVCMELGAKLSKVVDGLNWLLEAHQGGLFVS
jgi:tRNA(Phe) wybutosine-synthesizing methylase Tyw3